MDSAPHHCSFQPYYARGRFGMVLCILSVDPNCLYGIHAVFLASVHQGIPLEFFLLYCWNTYQHNYLAQSGQCDEKTRYLGNNISQTRITEQKPATGSDAVRLVLEPARKHLSKVLEATKINRNIKEELATKKHPGKSHKNIILIH